MAYLPWLCCISLRHPHNKQTSLRKITLVHDCIVCRYKCQITVKIIQEKRNIWAHILVQVTIYRRLRIGRDGHLDQFVAYDIS